MNNIPIIMRPASPALSEAASDAASDDSGLTYDGNLQDGISVISNEEIQERYSLDDIEMIPVSTVTTDLNRRKLSVQRRASRRKKNKLRLGLPKAFREYGDRIYKLSSPCVPYIETFNECSEMKQNFLISLGKDLSAYGTPVWRMEYLLESVSKSINIDSTFFAMPGLLIMSVKQNKVEAQTLIFKTSHGFQMGKLSAVNELCHDILQSRTTIEDAIVDLEEIRKEIVYSKYLSLMTFPLLSFVFCMIGFNGSWIEGIFSAILGEIVGIFQVLAGNHPTTFGYLYEFTAAVVTSFLANQISNLVSSDILCINLQVIVFSSLAILLPGLAITLSVIEISTRNYVSGTVRLFASLFTALLLGFGYSIGSSINSAKIAVCPTSDVMSWQWNILLIPMGSLILCYVLEARKSQFGIMVFVGTLGYVTFLMLSPLLSLAATATIATLVITVTSNIYARISRDISIAPILGGILFLTPGGFGLKTGLQFISGRPGENFAANFFVISISISVGIFIAQLLSSPIKRGTMKATRQFIF